MEYLFVLGNARELCLEELKSVLNSKQISFKIISSLENVVHLKTLAELDCAELMHTLGGTIKIAKILARIESEKELVKTVTSILNTPNKKIIFGLSWYEEDKASSHFNDIYHYSKEIKDKLERENFSVRYILPKNGQLSSVVVLKQKVKEIIIAKEDNQLVLAQTCAVQEFDQWNSRDYQRPEVLPEKGMLPPKVARMMVNIGCGKLEVGERKNLILLDPFCGMGTILAEGLLLGLKVYGSDQEQKAIDSSKKNLDWLCTIYNLAKKYNVTSSIYLQYNLMVSDATHISEKQEKESIDLIVTEPYLGPKVITPGYIERIIDGLERLYIGSLKDWYKVLAPGGIVVVVFPSFNINQREFFVKKVVDNCENLGYIIRVGPLPYSRPQAIVKRNIYILKKNTN